MNKKNLTYFRNLIAKMKQQKVELERVRVDEFCEILPSLKFFGHAVLCCCLVVCIAEHGPTAGTTGHN